ncbi:MAG: tRNA epoxyqueuosine(34) reductase QueG [Rhizobiaceae bacterium]|jgi:epoxyqueuosine reductase|nr:tRNA epoxyqueuosine(34) reductase QueG [Rhizobiaceae bacterium]
MAAAPDRALAMRRFLETEAAAKGFAALGVTSASAPHEQGERLRQFVAQGHHASMAWLAETLERRVSPDAMWPDAKSAIVFGMNYGPDTDPLVILAQKDRAAISVYAQNRDYHDIIKGRLKEIAQRFAARFGAGVKVFVDTAPLMEKPLAARAGLGWQGKHTNLVSRAHGSWLFLGVILTDAELAGDAPETDHCGSCRACLDICPTAAFPAPYQLDARRCISYLTIEHAGPIPHEFRAAIGNRIYGCDDCLAVCPWNKFAGEAREMKLKARDDLRTPRLIDLLALNDAGFRAFFAGSPVKRIGRDRFIRNVLIAGGNSADTALEPVVRALLDDPAPVVRGAAVWAYRHLAPPGRFAAERDVRAASEQDGQVRAEWEAPG